MLLERGSEMPRILVVEDEPTVRDAVARYLRREGFGVAMAGDGEEGLRLALEQRPDLVVLDLMLPGLDGLEVCRRLRATLQTPVVMLSSKDGLFDRARGRMVGSDQYLTKPFTKESLLRAVATHVKTAA